MGVNVAPNVDCWTFSNGGPATVVVAEVNAAAAKFFHPNEMRERD